MTELQELELRTLDNFARVSDILKGINETLEELRRGMAAVVEVMATRADLDDAKLELRDVIAEATATPFNPPEAPK